MEHGAVVRKRAVGGGDRAQRDLARAKRDRRHGRQIVEAEAARRLHRLPQSHLGQQLHGGAIARQPQALAQRQRFVIDVLVVRRPRRVRRFDRLVEVLDQIIGTEAVFDRRGIHERLERRAGLTPGERGAIEVADAKSRPPTMARTAPVSGSIAINAACSGSRGVLRFGSDFSISAML